MIGCFAGFAIDFDKIIPGIVSLSLALATLFFLRNHKLSTKTKIGLIYSHLAFLLFPLVFMTTEFACGVGCMPCYSSSIQLIAYSIPTTLVLALAAGFLVIPAYYIYSNKGSEIKKGWVLNLLKSASEKSRIKTPKLFLLQNQEPRAFSFRSFKSAIFLSAGIFDIFNKKEIEAVVLHELGHIANSSSILKFSSHVLRLFSPLSILMGFGGNLKEEEVADKFVIKFQKTSSHLGSAKRKMEKYFNYR